MAMYCRGGWRHCCAQCSLDCLSCGFYMQKGASERYKQPGIHGNNSARHLQHIKTSRCRDTMPLLKSNNADKKSNNADRKSNGADRRSNGARHLRHIKTSRCRETMPIKKSNAADRKSNSEKN